MGRQQKDSEVSEKQYDNSNKGVLFRNDRKERDNHPDYQGSINIDGRDYWLSAWIKTDKTGKKYMSLAPKAKDAEPAKPAPREPGSDDAFDDDLPF